MESYEKKWSGVEWGGVDSDARLAAKRSIFYTI